LKSCRLSLVYDMICSFLFPPLDGSRKIKNHVIWSGPLLSCCLFHLRSPFWFICRMRKESPNRFSLSIYEVVPPFPPPPLKRVAHWPHPPKGLRIAFSPSPFFSPHGICQRASEEKSSKLFPLMDPKANSPIFSSPSLLSQFDRERGRRSRCCCLLEISPFPSLLRLRKSIGTNLTGYPPPRAQFDDFLLPLPVGDQDVS